MQLVLLSVGTLDFYYIDIELCWESEGIHEMGIGVTTRKIVVAVSEDCYRPTDVVNLWGDATKTKKKLSWNP